MSRSNIPLEKSLLIVIDVQEALVSSIVDIERVLSRQMFMAEIAKLLEVPVVVTEQNPARMGGTEANLKSHLPAAHPKMSFSVVGSAEAMRQIEESGRTHAVLAGIETHICVSQTAHDLLERGFNVIVCADATSSRTLDRHQLGLARIRDAGAVVAHSEAIAYEWMKTAEHPRFRQALQIVKAY